VSLGLLGLSVLAAPACTYSLLCTLIGCGDSLLITLQPEMTLPYAASISFPGGQVVTFECTTAGVQARTGPYLSLARCDGSSFRLECGGAPDFCGESPVMVEIVGGDGARRGGRLSPERTLDQPNGPRCEPTCRHSSATLR